MKRLLLLGLAFLLLGLIVACEQATPSITIEPASFNFTAEQEGINPSSQTLNIRNSGSGTLSWSASSDADWLILNPDSGNSTGELDNVTLSVNISGMDSGHYVSLAIVSAPGAINTPQTAVVSLSIKPPHGQEEEVIAALDTETLLAHAGEVRIVEGIVVTTYYAEKSEGKPTFLDFHDPYEGYFKALIWDDNRDKFIQAFPPNPETYFLNKKVRIKGLIETYEEAPEIILNDPSQIWIVQ
jgi:hypothetical protein